MMNKPKAMRTFNRTIQELKSELNKEQLFETSAFNRTIQELKC